MKKISSRSLAVVIAVLTGMLSGCTSFKYVGQTFPEVPYSTPVPMYMSKAEVPAGTYAIMGRGVLLSRKSMDRYDLEEALSEEARSRGADAYCVLGTKVVHIGTFGYEDDSLMLPVSSDEAYVVSLDPNSNDPKSKRNSFGEYSDVDFGETVDTKQVNYRKEYQTRVLFLKDRVRLEAILQERDAVSPRERRSEDQLPGPTAPDVAAPPKSAESKPVTEAPKSTESKAVTEAPKSAESKPVTEAPKSVESKAVTEVPKSAESKPVAAPEKKSGPAESAEPENVRPTETPAVPAKAIPASPETPPAPQK